MPNIKSAIKRVEVARKKNAENKIAKSKINTFTKKYKTAIANNDIASAENLLKEVVSIIDCASKDNVIHKNSASRKVAHLTKLLDSAKKAQ